MTRDLETPVREGPTEAIDRTSRASRPRPLAVIVTVHGAPAEPRSLRLADGSIVVGAGPTADLVIDSPTVSRVHLELTLVEEGVRVRDLDSRNGTHYQGQRVEAIVVAPGCRLTLGSAELTIEADLSTLEGETGPSAYRGLLAASPAMRKLFAALARLEGSLVSVLLLGESGVGKELVARALHNGSKVASGPFVAKNCATMTRELVQSELFGHRRGAFTGASESRAGAFEVADGGTLFLDEIGELPIDVQPMLLRVLESGELSPLGSNEVKKVKVRAVAATNRPVDELIRAGKFREDLYYRLAVVRLSIAPLRDRPEDLPLLAAHFARLAATPPVPDDVMARWQKRAWPGNVRELRNAVEAYGALGSLLDLGPDEGDLLGVALRRAVDLDRPFQEQKETIADEFARAYLTELLTRAQGNQSEASRISGVERSQLRRLFAKHGLLDD